MDIAYIVLRIALSGSIYFLVPWALDCLIGKIVRIHMTTLKGWMVQMAKLHLIFLIFRAPLEFQFATTNFPTIEAYYAELKSLVFFLVIVKFCLFLIWVKRRKSELVEPKYSASGLLLMSSLTPFLYFLF